MKKLSSYFISLLIVSSLFFISCRENKTKVKEIVKTEKETVDEFRILVTFLEENGNFINSTAVPAMINTSEVHENMNNKKYLIIDIRKAPDFEAGHIENAINIPAKNMISYFENDIDPSTYEKIAMVCYSGQSASFTTGVMRLLGYDNVYAMKYGMSSWSKDLAENIWSKHISNDFVGKLETKENLKPSKGAHPTIKTGETDPYKILKERAQLALDTPYKSLLVKAPELFENPSNYFTVNYWPKEKYDIGHVPGAYQYTPKKSLSTNTELYTLPIDKEIVTYCYTGQHAAFVTAYLNILGYDAKALAYGANSFMNEILKEKKWHAFTPKKIEGYKVVAEALVE
jgi:rhodanese-related sulfurtransferase